jgi:hypothetical protein
MLITVTRPPEFMVPNSVAVSQNHLQHASMDSEDTLMSSRADREVHTRNPGLIIQALVAEPVLGRPLNGNAG